MEVNAWIVIKIIVKHVLSKLTELDKCYMVLVSRKTVLEIINVLYANHLLLKLMMSVFCQALLTVINMQMT